MNLSDLFIAEDLKELRESDKPEDATEFYKLLEIASDNSVGIFVAGLTSLIQQ